MTCTVINHKLFFKFCLEKNVACKLNKTYKVMSRDADLRQKYIEEFYI